MITFNQIRQPATVLMYDLLMVPIAWLGAFWLRFNLGYIPDDFMQAALHVLPVVIVIQGLVFWYFGLYRGVWRFASMPDLMRITKAVFVGAVVCAAILFSWNRLQLIPRSVPYLYGVLLFMLLGGSRFLYRWLKDHRLNFASSQRVMIVGAGKAAELLARDLMSEASDGGFTVVGFVDDNWRRQGSELRGIRVWGAIKQLPDLVDELAIELIIIAIPSANTQQMCRMVDIVERCKLPFRTLPQLSTLMTGKIDISQIREVSIDDLLGREQIKLDDALINQRLLSRVVLITGAGGSIGSELCRQIAQKQPAALVFVESSEHNLYLIEMEMRQFWPQVPVHVYLGDIRDSVLINAVMQKHRPDVIFHAAAYKHVPMLEEQVRQAISNNIIGTRLMANMADKYGCSRFVLISTDKAVNPANVMGMTKRVAELYCQNMNARSKTRFVTVRFGNVLGSAGSVVPLFKTQIERGGPVTVTHPNIERFFMTIPEACALIMQAAVSGNGGEIYVLDMGEPVQIRYLAEQMILLSGKVPGNDIKIEYTGLRPGEKLYEELFHDGEILESTDHEKLQLARYRVMDWEKLCTSIQLMEQAIADDNDAVLRQQLMLMVPEHQQQNEGITA